MWLVVCTGMNLFAPPFPQPENSNIKHISSHNVIHISKGCMEVSIQPLHQTQEKRVCFSDLTSPSHILVAIGKSRTTCNMASTFLEQIRQSGEEEDSLLLLKFVGSLS